MQRLGIGEKKRGGGGGGGGIGSSVTLIGDGRGRGGWGVKDGSRGSIMCLLHDEGIVIFFLRLVKVVAKFYLYFQDLLHGIVVASGEAGREGIFCNIYKTLDGGAGSP